MESQRSGKHRIYATFNEPLHPPLGAPREKIGVIGFVVINLEARVQSSAPQREGFHGHLHLLLLVLLSTTASSAHIRGCGRSLFLLTR